jgi:hypothetical protein
VWVTVAVIDTNDRPYDTTKDTEVNKSCKPYTVQLRLDVEARFRVVDLGDINIVPLPGVIKELRIPKISNVPKFLYVSRGYTENPRTRQGNGVSYKEEPCFQ